VPAGGTRPAVLRPRRGTVTVQDALKLLALPDVPIPTSLPLSPQLTDLSRDAKATTITYRDAGPLRPWRQYTYAVEVQGPPHVGASGGPAPAGEWSPPSVVATVVTIPPPPAPAGDFTA